MPPTPYDPIATVQQAIGNLLTTHEPEFIAIGMRLFLSFATIMLAWHGIRMMLSGRDLNEQIYSFAKLMLTVSFGYAMIAYYETPIPGIGRSFSNLVTDQTGYLASLISATSIQNAQQSLATLWSALEQPSLVNPRESFVLGNADRDRTGSVCATVRDVVWADRQRCMRASRPPLHPILHRSDTRMAVLRMAQSVCSVLVCPRGGECVHLRLRALSEPLRSDVAARSPPGRTAALWRARRYDPCHVYCGSSARTFSDKFNLFRPIRRITRALADLVSKRVRDA